MADRMELRRILSDDDATLDLSSSGVIRLVEVDGDVHAADQVNSEEPLAGQRASVTHLGSEGGTPALVVVPAFDGDVLLNGSPVGVMGIAHPGETLSIRLAAGMSDWLLVRSFAPELETIGTDRANETCALCGMALSCATVVLCSCGVAYHQESGPRADGTVAVAEDPLDCYVRAQKCHGCGDALTLEPRTIPDPRDLGLMARAVS